MQHFSENYFQIRKMLGCKTSDSSESFSSLSDIDFLAVAKVTVKGIQSSFQFSVRTEMLPQLSLNIFSPL